MASNFPAQFPTGPLVDPGSGRMTEGMNGRFFLLALFNRTGGPGGSTVAASDRTPFDGLTVRMPAQTATPRNPAEGLTIDMIPDSAKPRPR